MNTETKLASNPSTMKLGIGPELLKALHLSPPTLTLFEQSSVQVNVFQISASGEKLFDNRISNVLNGIHSREPANIYRWGGDLTLGGLANWVKQEDKNIPDWSGAKKLYRLRNLGPSSAGAILAELCIRGLFTLEQVSKDLTPREFNKFEEILINRVKQLHAREQEERKYLEKSASKSEIQSYREERADPLGELTKPGLAARAGVLLVSGKTQENKAPAQIKLSELPQSLKDRLESRGIITFNELNALSLYDNMLHMGYTKYSGDTPSPNSTLRVPEANRLHKLVMQDGLAPIIGLSPAELLQCDWSFTRSYPRPRFNVGDIVFHPAAAQLFSNGEVRYLKVDSAPRGYGSYAYSFAPYNALGEQIGRALEIRTKDLLLGVHISRRS